jgi:hypothetical protein
VIERRPLIDPEPIPVDLRSIPELCADPDRSGSIPYRSLADNRMMIPGLSLVEIRVDP